jgi:hypothetical protein
LCSPGMFDAVWDSSSSIASDQDLRIHAHGRWIRCEVNPTCQSREVRGMVLSNSGC